MNDLSARVAYINSQVACMLAKMAAMQADNQIALFNGVRPPHGLADFESLEAQFGLGHNAVIGYLREG